VIAPFFSLGGLLVIDGFKQPLTIEPGYPFQGGQFLGCFGFPGVVSSLCEKPEFVIAV